MTRRSVQSRDPVEPGDGQPLENKARTPPLKADPEARRPSWGEDVEQHHGQDECRATQK